jgi:hypothetical protein
MSQLQVVSTGTASVEVVAYCWATEEIVVGGFRVPGSKEESESVPEKRHRNISSFSK